MAADLFKPMLAAKPEPAELDAVLAKLRYPILLSTKFDGIRCMVQNGRLYTRSLKLVPNVNLQKMWGFEALNGLDGEIVVGDPTLQTCFQATTSVVMSRDKPVPNDCVFHVFDTYKAPGGFNARHRAAVTIARVAKARRVVPVEHTQVSSHSELLRIEKTYTDKGWEGVMLRDPAGRYKQGRSTLNEGGLIAVKRFVDAEALVLDIYEQRENQNSATVNELGHSHRSSHKANRVGKDTLGGFTVSMNGLKFNIGTGVGLTDERRAELWTVRKKLKGLIVKFRYQHMGTKEAPRTPIFLGFRDRKDL